MQWAVQTKNNKASDGICFSRQETNAVFHRSCTFGAVCPPENKFRSGYGADVVSTSDYYPFGMGMVERGDDGGYRYGFNGMQRDDEWQGAGNAYDFGARMYDGRLGRFLGVDPAIGEFPDWNGYFFSFCSPMLFYDEDGEKPRVRIINNEDGSVTIEIKNTLFIYSKGNRAKKQILRQSEINRYLQSGEVHFGDKLVHINIETIIVPVKNKSEAREKIDQNGGFGVIVKNGRGNGRAFHRKEGDYDYIRLSNSYNTERVLAHETGHDLGFADKYFDVDGGGKSFPAVPFTDGLMGGVQPLNLFEMSLIAFDVLHNCSLETTGGYPVIKGLDRIPKGQVATVVSWDYVDNVKMGENFKVKVTNEEGTPSGERIKEDEE